MQIDGVVLNLFFFYHSDLGVVLWYLRNEIVLIVKFF